MRAVGEGRLSQGWVPPLVLNPSPPNSQSPLEMRTSFRGARLGILGLMRSSTVTAAMALMLVDAVLWMEEKQVSWCSPPAWGHRLVDKARSSPEGAAVGTGQKEPGDSGQILKNVQHEQRHVLRKTGASVRCGSRRRASFDYIVSCGSA